MAQGVGPPQQVVWPRSLREGDLVQVIAPSGPPDRAGVERGMELLRSWGLRARLAAGVFAGDVAGYLAAPDDRRLADLHAAFADPEVAGVACVRGGYGAQRLLDGLDAALVQANPKVFWGFSDVTALHVALRQRAGLVTFSGPSVQWSDERLDVASANSLRDALFGHPQEPLHGEGLIGGPASGPLVGGNLSILSTLCGTVDELRAEGCVLLVEEVGERPYRVDRMLEHLRRAGATEQVAAVVFDGFPDCAESRPGRRSLSAREVAAAWAAGLGVPAVWGLPLGHDGGQRTVALGAMATVDGDAGTLEVRAGAESGAAEDTGSV